MIVESSPARTRELVREHRRGGQHIAVVPTMGALHAGHVSLIEAAREECDCVVATIFVNPTQFAPGEDFEKYPRTLEDDLARCEAAGADLVFTPQTSAMYADDAQTTVVVSELTKVLEGAHRPSHFDGVTTVVAKLFHITEPDRAYFGQKDFQQQLIIRQMVGDLDFGLQIVTCPIIREPDGLAMSSRNRYLSASQRRQSLALHQALTRADELAREGASAGDIQQEMRQILGTAPGVKPDYAVVVDATTLLEPAGDQKTVVALVAARVGDTRLIDNQILQLR
ncbi:MAG: pantoate--beta-alanine ligase [Planctomycetaceae bacterium]|nr:pantoate--beta-alanine ligase [Planctomycetaceae bacterium]